MIQTSYFAKSGNLSNAVSISGKTPDWFTGLKYPKLAPKKWFFIEYKNTGDEEQYIQNYFNEVLSKLDPYEVVKELDGKILLCYERPEKFCHRFVVADWIKNFTGVDVTEL